MKRILILGLSTSLLIVMALGTVADAADNEIIVAAAADLTFVFQDVATRFQKTTGNSLKLSFGSSGNFFSQIQNGAPYDMFFSADISYPKKLESAGLIEPGTLYEYARGRIVVWVPNESPLDVSRGLRVLLDAGIKKIAIANPEHAPYGRAAVAAMHQASVYDKVKSELIYGENIAQTAQFVQSGNADVGILALSLAVAPTMKAKGRYSIIPLSTYPPLDQAAVILKTSKEKKAARQFLAYLKSPETVEIFARYGFIPPGKSLAESTITSAAPQGEEPVP